MEDFEFLVDDSVYSEMFTRTDKKKLMAARLGITNDSMVMTYIVLSHSVQIDPQNNLVKPIGLFFFSHFTDEEIEAQ